jgi:hypothetical protein
LQKPLPKFSNDGTATQYIFNKETKKWVLPQSLRFRTNVGIAPEQNELENNSENPTLSARKQEEYRLIEAVSQSKFFNSKLTKKGGMEAAKAYLEKEVPKLIAFKIIVLEKGETAESIVKDLLESVEIMAEFRIGKKKQKEKVKKIF